MNPHAFSAPLSPLGKETCQLCGRVAQTRQATFMQNIGVIVLRFPKTVNGRLCRFCVDRFFWRYTLISALFGWWGVISFFTTLVAIPINVYNYVSCLGLASPPDDAESLAAKRTRGLAGMGCGALLGGAAALGVFAGVWQAVDSDTSGGVFSAIFFGAMFGVPALIALALGLRSFVKGRAAPA